MSHKIPQLENSGVPVAPNKSSLFKRTQLIPVSAPSRVHQSFLMNAKSRSTANLQAHFGQKTMQHSSSLKNISAAKQVPSAQVQNPQIISQPTPNAQIKKPEPQNSRSSLYKPHINNKKPQEVQSTQRCTILNKSNSRSSLRVAVSAVPLVVNQLKTSVSPNLEMKLGQLEIKANLTRNSSGRLGTARTITKQPQILNKKPFPVTIRQRQSKIPSEFDMLGKLATQSFDSKPNQQQTAQPWKSLNPLQKTTSMKSIRDLNSIVNPSSYLSNNCSGQKTKVPSQMNTTRTSIHQGIGVGNPVSGEKSSGIKRSSINLSIDESHIKCLTENSNEGLENSGMTSNVEQMLARLIAGDEKLKELLVKTTQCYIRDQLQKDNNYQAHGVLQVPQCQGLINQDSQKALDQQEKNENQIPYGNWLDESTGYNQICQNNNQNINPVLPLKTPEPSANLAAKRAKQRALVQANADHSVNTDRNLNNLKPSEGDEDHSLFQYSPSNYYDASGGGGTGATSRFYKDLHLKNINRRADSQLESQDPNVMSGSRNPQPINEEEDDSYSSSQDIVDEDIPYEDFRKLQQISDKNLYECDIPADEEGNPSFHGSIELPFSDKSRLIQFGSHHKNIELLNSFLTQVNLMCNANSVGERTDEKVILGGTGTKYIDENRSNESERLSNSYLIKRKILELESSQKQILLEQSQKMQGLLCGTPTDLYQLTYSQESSTASPIVLRPSQPEFPGKQTTDYVQQKLLQSASSEQDGNLLIREDLQIEDYEEHKRHLQYDIVQNIQQMLTPLSNLTLSEEQKRHINTSQRQSMIEHQSLQMAKQSSQSMTSSIMSGTSSSFLKRKKRQLDQQIQLFQPDFNSQHDLGINEHLSEQRSPQAEFSHNQIIECIQENDQLEESSELQYPRRQLPFTLNGNWSQPQVKHKQYKSAIGKHMSNSNQIRAKLEMMPQMKNFTLNFQELIDKSNQWITPEGMVHHYKSDIIEECNDQDY
ncbi:hypothetical protein FGO68_gene10943 [Halteria grandinella]|uniref:Uncharacterized protein n=1 Tax=Halteria grandinella TaxID=5974 RepID=A0A8J8T7N6_HALGN|nr:hypothetical protein FGO68_gene10943 [Halteria grandinella]